VKYIILEKSGWLFNYDLRKSGPVGTYFIKSELPTRDILKVIKKPGYEIRHELIDGKEFGGGDVVLHSAYTPNGDYVGDPKMARLLVAKKGIAPEKADPKHDVCSIGYSEKDGKYYGWSHRAICGFKIGDKVKRGDLTSSSGWTDEYLKEHPEVGRALPEGFEAKNKGDTRRMAIAFAEAVS
jgi:hypothetical protein